MEIPLLQDIFIIFGLAIAVVFVCQMVKVPPIVGFLVTGALAGPSGLGLVAGVHEVEVLAEIGVILLLFTIGIEFSLRSLLEIRRLVLLGGTLQVALTVVSAWLIAMVAGEPPRTALFLGFLVSLSSTAIVLKVLGERGEVSAPHGRAVLGVLILQDIAIVPMMLMVPILGGASADLTIELLTLILRAATIVLLVVVATQWFVPWMLSRIARTRSNELFLLGIAVLCFGVAWLTHKLGLSLALGAFLAGLIISESDYSHRALGNVLPFRDVFTSFFFVSVGMLLDTAFALDNALLCVTLALGVIVLKAVVANGVVLFMGMPARVAALSGLALAQVGEFSFVLSKAGLQYDLLSDHVYQAFLAVSLITMAATPFVMAGSHRITDFLGKLPMPERVRRGRYFAPSADRPAMRDHIVIVGYGVIGSTLARSAKLAAIPYQIIEINDETVRRERARGERIFYGDATQIAVLEHADLGRARVLVVAIPDPMATRRVVEAAVRLNPKVHVIARTRYVKEMDALVTLGAHEVVPEEFEASVAIFTRVLRRYLVPWADIETYVDDVRKDGYQIFRRTDGQGLSLPELNMPHHDVEVRVFRLEPQSELVGASLGEIDMRRQHDVSVLMVRRGGEVISNPTAEFHFAAGDIVVVLGRPDKITDASKLFQER